MPMKLNGEWYTIKSVLQDFAWGSHLEVTLHPCNYSCAVMHAVMLLLLLAYHTDTATL